MDVVAPTNPVSPGSASKGTRQSTSWGMTIARVAVPNVAGSPGTSSSAAFRQASASRSVSRSVSLATRSAIALREAASNWVENRTPPSSARRARMTSSVSSPTTNCAMRVRVSGSSASTSARVAAGARPRHVRSAGNRSKSACCCAALLVVTSAMVLSRRAIRALSGFGSPRSRVSCACSETSSPTSVRSVSRSASVMPREMSRSPGASSTRRSWARIRSADSKAAAASPSSACSSASVANADDVSRATGAEGRIFAISSSRSTAATASVAATIAFGRSRRCLSASASATSARQRTSSLGSPRPRRVRGSPRRARRRTRRSGQAPATGQSRPARQARAASDS